MGSFFFWLGLGIAIGIAYAVIRYGIPLIIYIVLQTVRTFLMYFKAGLEGFRDGWNQKPSEPRQ